MHMRILSCVWHVHCMYGRRGSKGGYFEGGLRAVGLLHGHGLSRTGYVNDRLFHVADWMPTLLRAVEAAVAADEDVEDGGPGARARLANSTRPTITTAASGDGDPHAWATHARRASDRGASPLPPPPPWLPGDGVDSWAALAADAQSEWSGTGWAGTGFKIAVSAPSGGWTTCPEPVATHLSNVVAWKRQGTVYMDAKDRASMSTVNYFVRRMYVEATPPARQLWLLKGGPGNEASNMQERARDLLALTKGGFTVYIPDHRGIGRSDQIACALCDGDLYARTVEEAEQLRAGFASSVNAALVPDNLNAADALQVPGRCKNGHQLPAHRFRSRLLNLSWTRGFFAFHWWLLPCATWLTAQERSKNDAFM